MPSLSQTPPDDFDWTKQPWFLEERWAEQLWGERYERHDLEQARDGLATIYPPSFCQAYLEKLKIDGEPGGTSDAHVRTQRMQEGLGRLLAGLYFKTGLLVEVLGLGVDLVRILPTKPQQKWVDRFRMPEGIVGAAFELEIWANGLRGNVPITRIPEARNQKTPDFLVTFNDGAVAIEAKDLSTGEDDQIFWNHLPLISPAESPPDDRTYHVEASDEIRDLATTPQGRDEYRRIIDDVHAALQNKLNHVAAIGWPIGEHVVPGKGRIVVESRSPDTSAGTSSFNFSTQSSPGRRARRPIDHLRNGAAKFLEWTGSHAGAIVFINVPLDYMAPETVAALTDELEHSPEWYAKLDAVVVRARAWHHPEDDDPTKTFQIYRCVLLRLPWCKIRVDLLAQLAKTLLASPHRLIATLRHRNVPDNAPTAAEGMEVYLGENVVRR